MLPDGINEQISFSSVIFAKNTFVQTLLSTIWLSSISITSHIARFPHRRGSCLVFNTVMQMKLTEKYKSLLQQLASYRLCSTAASLQMYSTVRSLSQMTAAASRKKEKIDISRLIRLIVKNNLFVFCSLFLSSGLELTNVMVVMIR